MPIFILSCLEDPAPNEIEVEFSSTYRLLQHLESKGDYINTSNVPTTLSASIVNSGQNFFKVIDLRSADEFRAGHIPLSKNIRPDSIFEYIENNIPDSVFVVLVSESGQLSGYITSLFWLAGYTNVYSLNFGIAAWNNDLAINVFKDIKDISRNFEGLLTNDEFIKADYSPLPKLNQEYSGNIEEFLIQRCKNLAEDNFLVENYLQNIIDSYLICYGDLSLYKAHSTEGPMPGQGHPIGAIHYQHSEIYDFMSNKNLQTIPSDQKIIVYSASGQLSAFVVAYLRLLGYKAYSLKYGASLFIYDRLIWGEYTRFHVFKESDVMDYYY
jgi:rhodanese-related sulfurtransferase